MAAGCFWGVEHMYRKHFGSKGLYDARVGYIGGDTKNPSYRSVCSGTTNRKLPLVPCLEKLVGEQGANDSNQTPKPPKSLTTPRR